jgi:membrane-associated phospholipid phosphatase
MIELLRDLDYLTFHAINTGMANQLLDLLCPVLREKTVWILAYIAIAYFAYVRYGIKVLWLGVIAAVMILLSDQISSSLIKPFFHRLRPCNMPDINGRLVIEHCGSGYSFVSSHAANHFALATFLSFIAIKKNWIPVAYLWAISIAFSQVYVGLHFPADVAAGGLLGILLGFIAGLVAKRIINTKSET